MTRPIVIGAGHNGLTAAFYLARAGQAPLVLERRSEVGGAAVTEEFAPGYRASLADVTGPIRPDVVRDMQLDRRVAFIRPDPRVVALAPDGRVLTFYQDAARTADAMRAFSADDARRYPGFCAVLARLAGVIEELRGLTPPDPDAPGRAQVWDLLRVGRRYRALPKADGFRLLRYLPMPVADLVAEWFDSDIVRSAVAARGIFGTPLGPWAAGTGAVLLMNTVGDPVPAGGTTLVQGGTGALTTAMADAAREAGAEIRTDTAVRQILVNDDRVTGVLLEDGTEVPATSVISAADPKTTLLKLVDPLDLDPSVIARVTHVRTRGTTTKIDFALSGLPAFRGVEAAPPGRIHIGPGIDYLERAADAAKYGECSAEPWLEATIPTLHDPSMAPPGRHVLSVCVHYTPYQLSRGRRWAEEKDALAITVLRLLDRYSPGLPALVEHRRVVSPADLEATYGLPGGHILHGEPALDQLFVTRPIFGWANYRTPIEGLFLCSVGTHPGDGLTAASGFNAAREMLRTHRRPARSTDGV